MSHERSTPSSPGAQEFVASSPTSTQSFSRNPLSFHRNSNGPITPFEDWCRGRSDDSFAALAGATAGFMSGVVTCPLDVIKTKLQAQGGFRGRSNTPLAHPVYSGMVGTAKIIWREEGLRGMYRGLGPIILGYLPTWAVYFTVYGKSKVFFGKRFENKNLVNFWSSIVGGACSTMITNPIWVIKTRLMSQVSRKSTMVGGRPPWHYKSTLDAARKMYRTEGLLSFYSGLTPALLGLTHVAVQFPTYEFLKTQFTGQGMGKQGAGDDSSHWIGVFSASVLSKVMASSATYPHEVIRTRLQTQQRTAMPSSTSEYAQFRGGIEGSEVHSPANLIAKSKATIPRYRGVVTTFKTILREEGWRAFYAGMGTNMMRAVPAATTTILTYEFVMKKLNQSREEGRRKSSFL
ncbi:mitochondrial folate transporter-like protein/carrier [Acephala macrosclerotiorum]|nr:mitochondrial folate transporter-like protein/carrier [Acephala macrosclerotiorum]